MRMKHARCFVLQVGVTDGCDKQHKAGRPVRQCTLCIRWAHQVNWRQVMITATPVCLRNWTLSHCFSVIVCKPTFVTPLRTCHRQSLPVTRQVVRRQYNIRNALHLCKGHFSGEKVKAFAVHCTKVNTCTLREKAMMLILPHSKSLFI